MRRATATARRWSSCCPQSETVNSKSIAVVGDVRDAVAHLPGVLGVTGLGAAQQDFLHAVYGNFPLVLLVIAVLTYLLLVRAFRSLLLPLKAVLLNLVSLAATLGAMVLFWQDGYGSNAVFGIHATGSITFWIPLMVFAFLFGLSMDYEVFILARVREEYDATRRHRRRGRRGHRSHRAAGHLRRADPVPRVQCARVRAGDGPEDAGDGLGIGILLDATIVRSALVPSLVSLIGRWNWYLPAGVAKLLRVEPSYPHRSRRGGRARTGRLSATRDGVILGRISGFAPRCGAPGPRRLNRADASLGPVRPAPPPMGDRAAGCS